MNSERLLAHYERIADAPHAIPRLRRFVLDLAVRGKLVPQDLKDEPAAELLKRIATEKARLTKAGKIKEPKAQPASEEVPFCLPSGWCWSQIGEIGVLSPRNEAPDKKSVSFIPMPLIPAKYGVAHKQEIRAWGEIKKGYTHFADGDVGLAKITPCFENGKSTIFAGLEGGIGGGTTELHIVRPILINASYLLIFLKSPYFVETGVSKMTGTAGQKRVPFEYFAYSPFPLPPLAEQHRIVAKVDELMTLCDRLEATRAEREATRDRLAAASLARLNDPDPDTFKDDTRFALDALPALTARADQIKQLRQTILELAVRGKLVPQQSNDKPASELLKQIAVEKARHGLKQSDSPLRALELPFQPLSGWNWSSLGQVCTKTGSGSTPRGGREVYRQTGIPFLRSQNVYDDGLRLDDVAYIDDNTHARMCGTIVSPGDLLLNITGGSIGRCCHVPDDFGDANVSQHVAIIRPAVKETADFLHLVVLSPYFQAFIFDEQTGAGRGGLPKNRMDKIPVPLPPLAEQRRIVARVNELITLCDQLETSLTRAEEVRHRVLGALLAEALTSEETRELEAAE